MHGPGIDEPIYMERDLNSNGAFEETERFFYHADGLGSTLALTNNAGQVVERYRYDSFGNPTILGPGPDGLIDTLDDVTLTESAYGNPYLFTSREWDPETGLYYYRSRYYDPRTGTFLQEENISGDDIHPTQRYLYTSGDPVNYIDPFGNTAVAIGGEIGAPFGIPGIVIGIGIGIVVTIVIAVAAKRAADQAGCPVLRASGGKDFPTNPDDWVPPPGVKEEPKAKESSGGKHRHWKDASGKTVRRWDKGKPGKPGNQGRDHWHDPVNRPGEHIPPNR